MFKKREPAAGLLPGDILGLLESYGHYVYNSLTQRTTGIDPRFDWPNFMGRFMRPCKLIRQEQPPRFTRPLSAISTHASAGARHMEVGDADSRDPLFLELVDEWINMVRERNLSSGYRNGYESKRWIELHDELPTTFDRIVEVATPSEPLQSGIELTLRQSVMVAKVGLNRLYNEFFIERVDAKPTGAYAMRQWDPNAT